MLRFDIKYYQALKGFFILKFGGMAVAYKGYTCLRGMLIKKLYDNKKSSKNSRKNRSKEIL